MKICILGGHFFDLEGPIGSSQHIARALAAKGHEVHYVTSHVNFPMLFFRRHRAKYLNARRAHRLANGVVQVTPVNVVPTPVLKRVEGTPLERGLARLNARLQRTAGRFIERQSYDLCIFSATPNITFLERVKASRYVYRHNDILEEFVAVPRSTIEVERRLLMSGRIEAVYTVNQELEHFIRAVNPELVVTVMANGVDLARFRDATPDPELVRDRDRNVVYVGSFDFWVDVALIRETAKILPGHRFHLYGTWFIPVPSDFPDNVVVHGPVMYEAIAPKLKACAVGIIPFGETGKSLRILRPLKYYEYLAAGLGVASTSFGGKHLEPLVEVGDTPEAFAAAVLAARALPERYSSEIAKELKQMDWSVVVDRIAGI